jgi:hypothetical protein
MGSTYSAAPAATSRIWAMPVTGLIMAQLAHAAVPQGPAAEEEEQQLGL